MNTFVKSSLRSLFQSLSRTMYKRLYNAMCLLKRQLEMVFWKNPI